MDSNFRVGIGQDSHRIKIKKKNEKRKTVRNLVLGGVEVERHYYTLANSDGDVVLHALCNALSSAIGGNSLGTWADKMCLEKDITDSKEYVKVIMGMIRKTDFKVNNVSIAVEAKVPKVSLQQVSRMKEMIGKLLSISSGAIGITFTSGEELTSFGRGEGIQVLAMVILVKNEKT